MTTNTNSNFAIVYKMSYAMALIEKGHKVISTMPNPQKPQLMAWIFEKTERFERDFSLLKG